MDTAPPSEYGRVTINNYSEDAGMAPVVFDHWLHRSMFTCRLCHVDIGFAMEAGGTNINKAGNFGGFYCGSCHDGNRVYDGKKIFAACADSPGEEDLRRCDRCHSKGKDVKKERGFGELAAKLPQKGLGNRIDWEEAEATGLIKPVDFLEGVSVKRPSLKPQEDFSIKSMGTWMTDVIFSHKKHAVWNGCEVCHPEIFPTVEKGATRFSMLEIYDGQYCGVCHNKVAFPLIECQRCHINPVQPQ
jgi:c(7)-type cytochrome triheme protein